MLREADPGRRTIRSKSPQLPCCELTTGNIFSWPTVAVGQLCIYSCLCFCVSFRRWINYLTSLVLDEISFWNILETLLGCSWERERYYISVVQTNNIYLSFDDNSLITVGCIKMCVSQNQGILFSSFKALAIVGIADLKSSLSCHRHMKIFKHSHIFCRFGG